MEKHSYPIKLVGFCYAIGGGQWRKSSTGNAFNGGVFQRWFEGRMDRWLSWYRGLQCWQARKPVLWQNAARKCAKIPVGHGACPPSPLGGRNVGQRVLQHAGAAQSLITVPGAGLPYVALAAKQPQRVVLHRVFDPQQGELPANPAQIGLAGVNSLCRCAKSDKRVVRQLFPACQTTAHMAVGGRGQCPPGRVAGQFAAIPAIPALFASDGDAMKTNSLCATFVMPWPTCQPTG